MRSDLPSSATRHSPRQPEHPIASEAAVEADAVNVATHSLNPQLDRLRRMRTVLDPRQSASLQLLETLQQRLQANQCNGALIGVDPAAPCLGT